MAWGLKSKLFTCTVDNAGSNSTACDYLKKMCLKFGCLREGELMHMRCAAHIINLIVWDGLKLPETVACLRRVREAVKWIKASLARLQNFKDLAIKFKVESKQGLCLDVVTRWNSTYNMLEAALKYQDIFGRMNNRYDEDANIFGAPTDENWRLVGRLMVFLKEFKHLIDRVSGSLYVTSNNTFFYVANCHALLNSWVETADEDFNEMAKKMKEKYDKYWGDIEKMNPLLYMGVILDPTFKLEGVELTLQSMYGPKRGKDLSDIIKKEATSLLEEYARMYNPLNAKIGNNMMLDILVPPARSATQGTTWDFKKSIMKKVQQQKGSTSISEFDRYLSDPGDLGEADDNVLEWWRLNEHRYPILARAARDIFAVQVSTVASESAFSTGGRTLDQFRSSLTPKMVQSLICTQDWRRPHKVDVEERLEDMEKLEEGLAELAASMPDDIICVDD